MALSPSLGFEVEASPAASFVLRRFDDAGRESPENTFAGEPREFARFLVDMQLYSSRQSLSLGVSVGLQGCGHGGG